ncbi:MAG: phosphotransferase, partial [Rhodoferax sp.]|nr:phosphotransferase [Rhodoferax sp.]
MSHSPLPTSDPSQPASPPTLPAIVWADALRADAFARWLQAVAATHGVRCDSLRAASADASFRRYFRIDAGLGSYIIMDAPPQHENCQPFVTVAQLMRDAGLRVPEVLAWDQANGFMLLTDLGGQTMMQCIDPANAQANRALYLQAVQALIA